jgi:hypothetical protein|uniref:Uncharacterized protein n=1 Tax=viral metagenome TaxID=1070528 RepID=A0A6C0H2B3_9ZZZZ
MELIVIILLVLLLLFLLLDKRERFTPNLANNKIVKQCDFNDKNLSGKCKEIRDGCSKLNINKMKMKNNLARGCDIKNREAKTVRETISQRRDCVTDVERYIRANYAKTELCAQIKNMPSKINLDENLNDLNLNNVLPNDINGSFSDAKF